MRKTKVYEKTARRTERNKWRAKKNTEEHSLLVFLVMCNCFSLFPYFCSSRCFFCDFSFFSNFFYFSLDQQHIRRKHTKFQNFLCKDVASGKSAKSLKSVQKLRSSDRQSSQGNFAKIESAKPTKLGRIGCKIFCRCPRIKFFLDSESVCESYSCLKFGLRIRVGKR